MELTTLLLIAAAFIFGAGFTFLILRLTRREEISRSQYDKALQDSASLLAERDSLARQYNDVRIEKRDLQNQVVRLSSEISQLHGALGSRSGQMEQAEKTISELKSQMTAQQSENKSLSAQMTQMKEQLVQSNAELEQAKKELNTQKEEIEKLGSKLKMLSKCWHSRYSMIRQRNSVMHRSKT